MILSTGDRLEAAAYLLTCSWCMEPNDDLYIIVTPPAAQVHA